MEDGIVIPSNATGGGSSGFYSVSPYIGFRGASPKTQYYRAVSADHAGIYVQSLRETNPASHIGVRSLATPSERWKWGVNVIGQLWAKWDTASFTSQQTVVVGEVPGTGSGSASYLSNAGNITYIVGSVDLSYRKSAKDTLVVSGSNSFSRISGYNQQGSVAGVKTQLYPGSFAVVELSSVMLRIPHFYGDLNCDSSGVGAGMRWQPTGKDLLFIKCWATDQYAGLQQTETGIYL